MEEAYGWVGKGHMTLIEPPPIPICGPRSPMGGDKDEPKKGRGKCEQLGKRKQRGCGWAKEKRGFFFFFFYREFLSLHIWSFFLHH